MHNDWEWIVNIQADMRHSQNEYEACFFYWVLLESISHFNNHAYANWEVEYQEKGVPCYYFFYKFKKLKKLNQTIL